MRSRKITKGMRRLGMLAAFCLLICLMTGCSVGASVDTLLKPPSLSQEQQQIYLTLQDAVGGSITLQYPRSGTNLSAFTVTDLDDDGDDEALVFYEKTSFAASENNLRISILDQVDAQWQAVCDIPADGAEIECVEIATIGEAEHNRIFLGYSGADQSDKSLTVYSYMDSEMALLFQTAYTMFDVADLDNDSQQELLVLGRVTDSAAAYVSLYRMEGDNFSLSGKLEMRTAFLDYSQVLYSTSTDDTPGIWIDGTTGTSSLQTEILCVDDGMLSYVLPDTETVASTTRSVGYLSMDINGDGRIEIPVQELFPGYDEDASEQVRLTKWLGLSGTALVETCRGYFSLSDGCMFCLPLDWYSNVTAATNALTGDLIFYRYDGAFTEDMTELMRYSSVHDEEEIDEREADDYQLLHTKGKAYYYMRAAATDDSFGKSWQDLMVQFVFVS